MSPAWPCYSYAQMSCFGSGQSSLSTNTQKSSPKAYQPGPVNHSGQDLMLFCTLGQLYCFYASGMNRFNSVATWSANDEGHLSQNQAFMA